MPSLPHRPALAPRDGISSFLSVQSSDSYYSDEEIAIIHDVVTAAQENLELLPEGERLATNALFQAYDAVLPLYGIDPEEDHHISRLVFRIGGERGDGSLLEKLRAVLSRMGIGLEFDSRSDGSRVLSDHGDGPDHEESSHHSPALMESDRNSESFEYGPSQEEHPVLQPAHPGEFGSLPSSQSHEAYRLDDSASPPRLTRADPGPNRFDMKPINHSNPPRIYTPSTDGNTEQSHQSRQSIAGSNEQRGASDTAVQPVGASSNNSVKDKNETPTLPIRSKPLRTVNWLLPPDTITEPIQNGGDVAHVEDMPEVQEPAGHERDVQRLLVPETAVQELHTHQPAEQERPVEKSSESHVNRHKEEQIIDSQPQEEPEEEARYALLERQSKKAAGYLLLLKGISHWKQHALDKLERTAVARRHILRMRHFDSWELVTADTRFKGRRVFASRLLALWLRRADDDNVTEHYASAFTQRKLAQDVLIRWSASYPAYIQSQHPPLFVTACLQHWRSVCVISYELRTHVKKLRQRHKLSQVAKTWHRQAVSYDRDIAFFHRFSVIRDCLTQWHLDTRVEVFRAKMGVKLIRASLSRWQSACRAPPSLGQANIYGRGRAIDPQTGLALLSPPQDGNALMAISDRMLVIKVLGNWQRQASAVVKASTRSRRFAAHQATQKALESWHFDVDRNRSVNAWTMRGCFYVSVTHTLKTWRSRASWRSSTRKSYARCRQHVKATFTKGYLGRWRTATRAHGNISWGAKQRHSVMERDRLVHMLSKWRDESSNDWGASRLLVAAWVGEWLSMSQDLAGTQDRAKQDWGVTLKSRYWSQWQSTLLQLKSREYVALDVRERNSKKVVRRLLLHWKGDRDLATSHQSTTTRTNFASSRRGAGLGLGRSSVPLSRAVHERAGGLSLRGSRIQEVAPTVDEEDHDGAGSGPDADGVVMDTPTRWTGMASSVRLPSMTPFAPLPTPFERELRERYNRSVPAAPTGQLSRLSFAQAQRLSVVDTQRATNDSRPAGSGRGE